MLFGQKLRPCVNREFSVSAYRFGVRAGFDEPIFVNPAFFAENRAKESRGFRETLDPDQRAALDRE